MEYQLSKDYTNYIWQRGEKPTKEDLEILYINHQLNIGEIATILNSSKSSVGRWIKSYGIIKPSSIGKLPKDIVARIDFNKLTRNYYYQPLKRGEQPTKEDLEYLYITLNLAQEDIASLLGKSIPVVVKILHQYNILKPSDLTQQCREEKNLRKYGTRFANTTEDALLKKEQTNLKKYGVKSLLCDKDFREGNMLNKYGVRHALESTEIMDKMKRNNLEKWGVEYTTQNEEIVEKMKSSLKERYGVDNVFKLKKYQEISIQRMQELYGVRKYAQKDIKHIENMNKEFWEKEFYDSSLDAFDIEKCAEYHNISLCNVGVKLKEFGIDMRTKYSSKNEYAIYKYIKELGEEVKRKDRYKLDGLELDVYVPDKNFAIEYDGLAFHSSGNGVKEINKSIPSNYHYLKTDLCKQQGIQLFHIFENEWVDPIKRDIWKSVISNKLGKSKKIYGRQTTVKSISIAESIKFCNQNHLQGGCNCKVAIALYQEDEIVAVMTFGKPRFNNDADWELIRYCCKKYTTVVGGASKLLTYFRKHYKGSIVSYANLRWSDGNLYQQLGFTYIHKTQPNYFYFKVKHEIIPVDMVLYPRQKFQKHKLKDILPNFDNSLTEKENMYNNNYRTIYDCGNYVYKLS